MTLQKILDAIDEHDNDIVKVTLTGDRVVKGVLRDAFKANPEDPREGYSEDYFYIFRVDGATTPIAKYYCEEVVSIEAN